MSPKPALRPELAIGEALRAIAHDIFDHARAALENPKNSSAATVHELRRQMKRWRAFLRLLEPFVGKNARDQRIVARNLARDLVGARDPQSAREAFDDLAAHRLQLSKISIMAARKRIDDLRTAGEKSTFTVETRQRIADVLADAGAAIGRWPLHTLTFADVAGALTASYRAARRAAPKRWSDAETLHEFRKLVVIHRYQMEIVEPLWARFTKMWITEVQRLRERLGRHQDLEVLRKLTAPRRPLAQWRARLERPIAARKLRHLAVAKRSAARLFVEKPSAFQRRLMTMWKTG